jgi:hypothetical protein
MELAVIEDNQISLTNTYKHDWIHIIYMLTSTISFVTEVYQRISIDFLDASC